MGVGIQFAPGAALGLGQLIAMAMRGSQPDTGTTLSTMGALAALDNARQKSELIPTEIAKNREEARVKGLEATRMEGVPNAQRLAAAASGGFPLPLLEAQQKYLETGVRPAHGESFAGDLPKETAEYPTGRVGQYPELDNPDVVKKINLALQGLFQSQAATSNYGPGDLANAGKTNFETQATGEALDYNKAGDQTSSQRIMDVIHPTARSADKGQLAAINGVFDQMGLAKDDPLRITTLQSFAQKLSTHPEKNNGLTTLHDALISAGKTPGTPGYQKAMNDYVSYLTTHPSAVTIDASTPFVERGVKDGKPVVFTKDKNGNVQMTYVGDVPAPKNIDELVVRRVQEASGGAPPQPTAAPGAAPGVAPTPVMKPNGGASLVPPAAALPGGSFASGVAGTDLPTSWLDALPTSQVEDVNLATKGVRLQQAVEGPKPGTKSVPSQSAPAWPGASNAKDGVVYQTDKGLLKWDAKRKKGVLVK